MRGRPAKVGGHAFLDFYLFGSHNSRYYAIVISPIQPYLSGILENANLFIEPGRVRTGIPRLQENAPLRTAIGPQAQA